MCQNCGSFGWNELDESGYYLCRNCFGAHKEKKPVPETYRIPSVKLMPVYIGSSLFQNEEIEKMVREFMMCRSDSQEKTVGYDKGILLYCLTKLHMPAAEKMLEEVLEQADGTDNVQ